MRQRLSRQRLSLTGQLLVRLAIVVIVVIGVVFVTLARETARFRDLEEAAATAAAETLAASRITRDAIVVPDLRSALDALAEGARSSSGATARRRRRQWIDGDREHSGPSRDRRPPHRVRP